VWRYHTGNFLQSPVKEEKYAQIGTKIKYHLNKQLSLGDIITNKHL
jgi:hypothetical protein